MIEAEIMTPIDNIISLIIWMYAAYRLRLANIDFSGSEYSSSENDVSCS